jgi:hypothetical protein
MQLQLMLKNQYGSSIFKINGDTTTQLKNSLSKVDTLQAFK